MAKRFADERKKEWVSIMRLSAVTYYADYVVQPVAAAGLITVAMATTATNRWGLLSLTILAGLATWPLAEYQLHRWAFHHLQPMKRMHEAHHKDGKALIGTPWWISLPLIAVLVLLPAILIAGFAYGAGFTAGMMFGYTAYMILHHGLHHWRILPGSYLYGLKRHHALHHRFDDRGDYDEGNYGVVTRFWDRVFGTEMKIGRNAGRA